MFRCEQDRPTRPSQPGDHPAPRPTPLLGSVLAVLMASAMPAAAATITVDFDTVPGGTTLTTQISGVTFPAPTGTKAIARGDARSAPNVGQEPFNGEFARHPFEAVFTANQNTVSVWVKPETGSAPASTATLYAYDAGSGLIDTDAVAMTGASGWQLLSVGSAGGAPQIRRIVLREVQGSFETNFVIVDDLEAFSADPPPPPPPADTTPPVVDLLQPSSGAVLTTRFGTVRVTASDNQELFEVKGTIRHQATNTVVGTIDACGPTSTYGACPSSVDRSHGFELDQDLTGSHVAQVQACDASANCATDSVTFQFVPAPPPADVEAWWIELNQGVQGDPRDAFDFAPGTDTTYHSQVPLIRLKDLLVRVYLLADGAARPGFTAGLRVTVHNRDGSTDFLFTLPNAGASTVDVEAKAATAGGRLTQRDAMRVDLARTLNFVVPALAIADATRLELELDDVSGTIEVPMPVPTKLNVLTTRIVTPEEGGTHAGFPPADMFDRIEPYLDQTFPAWVVASIPRPTAIFRVGSGLQAICQVFTSSCGCTLWQFSMTSSLSPSSPIYTSPGPNGEIPFAVRLGVVGFNTMDGALGCAYVGNPGDGNQRRYGPAVTEAFGDVAAQEIGHAMGLIHAGNSHGESGGGSAETGWPYPHGTIGERNFGVVLERTSGAPSSFGTWQVTLVDACPGSAGAARNPCPLPDNQQAHDFMSYGSSNTNLGPLNGAQFGNSWVSDLTYSRLYDAIRFGNAPSYSHAPLLRADAVGKALVVSGVVKDGIVDLLPALRKDEYLALLQGASTGPYSLELYDEDGKLLNQRSFTPATVTDHEHPHQLFVEELPDEPTLHRITIRKSGAVVAQQVASDHAPQVKVLAPNGGEVFAQGKLTVRWQASDADGDDLVLMIEVSTDDGASWYSVASAGPGDPTQVVIPVGEIAESRKALVRVRASDGMREATDRSDCTFSVNTAQPPICNAGPGPDPEDPDPPSSDFFTSPVFPDFGFQVRITAGGGPIAGTFEPSCIPETLCVSGALPGRSEVFLRVVGPKPNGKLWPTLVKFSTAKVEVWIKQLSSGAIRYYDLAGASPGFDVLPGLFDRQGFDPAGNASAAAALASVPLRETVARAEAPPLPPGPFLTSPEIPGFRFKVRIQAGGEPQPVQQEPVCIEETICASGALPGRSEIFLRIVGPKPNGYLWPTLVKFTTSQVEVWIEQIATGNLKYYVLEGAAPGIDELPGLFDREGFLP